MDKAIPDAMRQAAVTIFAFDALVQNPDRRFNNQNLLTRGDDIFVFDHEVAFSFLLDILRLPVIWRPVRFVEVILCGGRGIFFRDANHILPLSRDLQTTIAQRACPYQRMSKKSVK